MLTVPHFLHERLRLELRPSYTRETTQRYYGLGNDSVAPQTNPGTRLLRPEHPTVGPGCAGSRGGVFVELGAAYTENWFALDPQSTLAADISAGRGLRSRGCWAPPPVTGSCSSRTR